MGHEVDLNDGSSLHSVGFSLDLLKLFQKGFRDQRQADA